MNCCRIGAFRSVSSSVLALPILLLGAAPACTRPGLVPRDAPRKVEEWKQQCGLLWILVLEKDEPVRIRITGKGGETLDYGGGFVIGNHHLASSFCRTDLLVLETFRCRIDAGDGALLSGRLEAWFNGNLLQTWALTGVRHYDASAGLPR